MWPGMVALRQSIAAVWLQVGAALLLITHTSAPGMVAGWPGMVAGWPGMVAGWPGMVGELEL